MRAILIVFLKEFRENLRERRTFYTALILGPLLGPALFAGLLALQLHRGVASSDKALPVAVAHGERAPNLIAYLTEAGAQLTPTDVSGAAAPLRAAASGAAGVCREPERRRPRTP